MTGQVEHKESGNLNQKIGSTTGGDMINIQTSQYADTRTCDFKNVSKQQLMDSSRQHIGDIVKAMAFFAAKIVEAAGEHDYDKMTEIDLFHSEFVEGFKTTEWYDNHRKIHRHHLDQDDGIPDDVNLIDVLEYVADCVMAGMGRSGKVRELELSNETLRRAFENTVVLLKSQVVVGDVEDLNIYKRAMESMAAQFVHPKTTAFEMAKQQLRQQ